ncbi:MAG: DegV family EDD domain-containing protein [Oscillospiraceae bacterium]|nr:DegV family EDD domain-containing protein [Oscillospiraceae bacterium]
MKKRLTITADCTCDLSDEIIEKYNIKLLPFNILTERWSFRDRDEITARNVLDYISSGGQARSEAPGTEECIRFFSEQLDHAEKIIHICMSSEASLSFRNCCQAMKEMDDKAANIWLLDSKHLSTGTGHIVIKACELAEKGIPPEKIKKELEIFRERISTSFIVRNADYLYNNKKAGLFLRKVCSLFELHPVIVMRNGRLRLKKIYRGDYEKAELRYVTSELKNNQKIDNERLFITHAGCSFREIETLRKRIERITSFKEICTTEASAVVSSNCGPNSVGVIYVREQNERVN